MKSSRNEDNSWKTFNKEKPEDMLSSFERINRFNSEYDMRVERKDKIKSEITPLVRLKATKIIQKWYRGYKIRKKFYHVIIQQLKDFREHRLLKNQIKAMQA